MLSLLRWLLFLVFLLPLLLIGAVPFIVLEPQPLVATAARLTPEQIARAKALITEHDPRRQRDGQVRTLALKTGELDLMLEYLLDRMAGGASRVDITADRMTVALTARVPDNPIGSHVNIELVLAGTSALPRTERLRLGRLTLPGVVVDPLLSWFAARLKPEARDADPFSLLRRVTFSPGRLALEYEWQSGVVEAIRSQLVSPADEARLRDFHAQLVTTAAAHDDSADLSALLSPLFALGMLRAAEGDPVADNRAALVVLSAYVSGQSLRTLVPAAADWPAPKRLRVKAHGRVDLAKHFLNSAALAATGGQAIAQVVGLSKEVDDSRGGSGFSFVDLLADEAGTRFGRRATESRVMARELQKRASEAQQDIDWIPSPQGLQEQMPEPEFKRRYGGIEGAGYRKVFADITRRIDAMALYR